jgi:sugar-specific transcriptional regulator TrmB
MLKTLVGLGLTQVEAEVYLFLAQTGPAEEKDIAQPLRLRKRQLDRGLESLKCKGCIKATLEHSTRFSAVPLEKVLDFFMKTKMEQAKDLQAKKAELLSSWNSMIKKNPNTSVTN